MPEFHPFTLQAASEVLAKFYRTNDSIEALVFGWGCDGIAGNGYMSSKFLSIVRAATGDDAPRARTAAGDMSLARAFIEEALRAPEAYRQSEPWVKLIAGLRFDGFEVVAERATDPRGGHDIFDNPREFQTLVLRRMLPEDLPGLDFREAESEVITLLRKHNLTVARGHLEQATSAFQRGDWAAANAQLRTFYQDLLDRIAVKLGCEEARSDDAKRAYLATESAGPFLLAQYNEWENDRGKPAFVLGLWARLHPQGSHPGLSEEDDCTFRLQVTLITARLFLRRLDQRISEQ